MRVISPALFKAAVWRHISSSRRQGADSTRNLNCCTDVRRRIAWLQELIHEHGNHRRRQCRRNSRRRWANNGHTVAAAISYYQLLRRYRPRRPYTQTPIALIATTAPATFMPNCTGCATSRIGTTSKPTASTVRSSGGAGRNAQPRRRLSVQHHANQHHQRNGPDRRAKRGCSALKPRPSIWRNRCAIGSVSSVARHIGEHAARCPECKAARCPARRSTPSARCCALAWVGDAVCHYRAAIGVVEDQEEGVTPARLNARERW